VVAVGPAESNNSLPPGYDLVQCDHLSGKRGNVREFDSCQGNVRDSTKVREVKKSCQEKVT